MTLPFPNVKNEFLCDDHYFNVTGLAGHAPAHCLLTVPFCMSIITNQTFESRHVVTQTSIGPSGRFIVERVLTEPQWQHYRSNQHVKTHVHNYTEFMYVMKGQVEEFIENGYRTYSEGHACLLNQNVPHCEWIGEDCTLIYLHFAKSYVHDLLTGNLIKKKAGILYNFSLNNMQDSSSYIKQYIEFIPSENHVLNTYQINTTFDTLVDELLFKKPGQQLMIQALLVRFFSYFLDYPNQFEPHHTILDTKSDQYLFNLITQYIEEYPGRPNRQTLAEHFHYSGDHINRIIKKHSGKSFVDYVREISLQKAAEMLKNSDLSISAIITLVGFENKSYFYDMFKRKYGHTPMEYRAMFR